MKGIVRLEDLFDQDDVARKPTLVPIEKFVEDANIRTKYKPKMIKLSKTFSPEVKEIYIHLFSKFSDVLSWDYAYLKEYDKKIIQHTIPIKPNQNTFRQNLRRINPRLLRSIEKEINRLLKVGIIAPIRFSNWISNLVLTRKNNREIRLCVDFRN